MMNSYEEAELLESIKSVNAVYSKTGTIVVLSRWYRGRGTNSSLDARSFVKGMRIEAQAAYFVRIIADQLLKAGTCIKTKASR